MRVYTCDDFTGWYPVGTAAVIVAPNEQDAFEALAAELRIRNLPTDGFTLIEVDLTRPAAIVLRDGDY